LLVEIRIAVQGVGKGGGGSKGKEMTQTLYAHMNKRKKTTLKFYLTPVRMAVIKKAKLTDADENVGEKEPLYTVGVNINK
jgi:hypothetical protein